MNRMIRYKIALVEAGVQFPSGAPTLKPLCCKGLRVLSCNNTGHHPHFIPRTCEESKLTRAGNGIFVGRAEYGYISEPIILPSFMINSVTGYHFLINSPEHALKRLRNTNKRKQFQLERFQIPTLPPSNREMPFVRGEEHVAPEA